MFADKIEEHSLLQFNYQHQENPCNDDRIFSCNKIHKRIKGCCCQWNFIEENLIKDISEDAYFGGRDVQFSGSFVEDFDSDIDRARGRF